MLEDVHMEKLRGLLEALIDQEAAKVLVEPNKRAPGFWFGGGNVAKAPDGTLWLVGRYRNAGDSRTGLEAGERGLELALFRSQDGGQSFEKMRSWSKAELKSGGLDVLSIEGAALHFPSMGGCELFVSTEKDTAYPAEVAAFQKPGTGVWSLDLIQAESVDALDAAAIQPIPIDAPPEYLHVKDPVVFEDWTCQTVLVFCNHPFCWTCSNTGYALRAQYVQQFDAQTWEMVSRGPAWDVAGTRLTARMPIPRLGAFEDLPPLSVFFYDGLECVRALDENPRAVKRPRGFSCEEIGGALAGFDDRFPEMTRLSRLEPLFVSPHGTGCSRYVDVWADETGLLATWQQGQDDGSQPLVGHKLSMDEIERLLV